MTDAEHVLVTENKALRAELAEYRGEVQAWMDRLAVQDLIHRYSDAVTRADWDAHEAVFAPDAVWHVAAPFEIRWEGARNIREQLSGMLATYEFLVQTAHDSVIRLVGADRAEATTTIHEFMRDPVSGTNVEQYGVYYDRIVKLDGEWKFEQRSFQPVYVETDKLDGTAIAARNSLTRPPTS